MVSVALLCLVVGLAAGALIGHLYTRGRAALSALARAQVDAARGGSAHDLAQRQHAIAAMVGPLQSSLDAVQAQLRLSERDRLSAQAALDEHLAAMRVTTEGLRTETSQLVTALRAPQVRGRWGELQLERAVEAAGMVEHVDYRTQVTVAGPDGTVRPDLVVTLVGGREIVIDAKVAFSGYLEAMEATTEARRTDRLRAHARQLRAHVDGLADKTYWDAFESTPEFVVCFVPAEAFLDAALRQDPTLLEHALARNVVIATPSTLVALLRTIGYSWRQEALARNTAEVSKLGRELHQRLSTMSGHLDKVGRSLSSAVTAFNSTVGAFESRVLVTARRFDDLSVVDSSAHGGLPAPEQILATTRAVSSE
ncbi:DNA recombination protein RmuC [Jatrophihabitans telluris]|uniref:DNA recombination protein RmuC n=1 Tax=Jatrophihabitans telluris TaxID=2038343 RepID=A0ABY4QVR8_9ACTN|nr:DNA recombination protein RmuC [Jatrophihabitans telluris]UQX87753.1 DNA recombination protein RmuC [Jatrophihabitans telluris]